MTPFELAEPDSLAAAIKLLDTHDATIRPLAGGTALMLLMKSGMFRPTRLVSLSRIEPKYSAIAADRHGLRIGAMATLAALERAAEVRRYVPALARALETLANVRVRNVATVGGALAHADPRMDLPPLLIALGASVTVAGPTGERSLALEHLFTGYFETALQKDELIAELRVPAQGKTRAAYLKVTTGAADDWPALGVAVALTLDDEMIKSARVVVGAATSKATRLAAAEAALAGRLDDRALARAGEAAAEEAEIIADARGSAAYKRELLRVYVGRAARAALGGAR